MNRFTANQFPRWLVLMLLVLSLGLLIVPALVNGYPLIYPDTGTYIVSGHNNIVPTDRPLMYGLFVRHISMSASLWLVIIAQAILVGIILIWTARAFWKNSWITSCLLLTLFISIFTAVPNYISQIMPDVFASLVIVSMFLFFHYINRSKLITILLVAFIIFCNATHFSNLLATTILTFVLIIIALISKNRLVRLKQVLWLFLIIGITWLFFPTFNYLHGAGFRISQSNNIFLLARLGETGVLSDYLNENCGKKDIPLCKYKNNFPMPSVNFLFYKSPLNDYGNNKMRQDSLCEIKNTEYAAVVKDILKTPRHLAKFAGISITETLRTLTFFEVEPLPNSRKGTPVKGLIKEYYKSENKQFINAGQSLRSNGLQFETTGLIQTVSVIASLIGLLIGLVYKKIRKHFSSLYYLFLLMIITGIIANAWVCSTFSTTCVRYNSRMAWLIPLSFLVLIISVSKQVWHVRKSIIVTE